MKDITYAFDLPPHANPIIKVVGVGGGGSNAVNNMYKRGIKDVDFVVCNTDIQSLQSSSIQHKLQIGAALTGGLGAGANPEVGRNAALESKESILALFGNETKMLFITAGMGGGTGTGAAPVIASIARKQDILTVGIVTFPFSFEGKKKCLQAQEGVNALRAHCDTVLLIMNDKLQTTLGGLSITDAFLEADNVLTTAVKSIAEIITVPGYVNVDFEDVKTVMRSAGAAVMGSGEASGEGRALHAAEAALASPLLDYTDIRGAKKILLSIVSGQDAELQMNELTAITSYIQEQTGHDVEMIFGHGADPEMAEKLRVTVIATGFKGEQVARHTDAAGYLSNDSVQTTSSEELSLAAQMKTNKLLTQEAEVESVVHKALSFKKKQRSVVGSDLNAGQLPLPFALPKEVAQSKAWRQSTAATHHPDKQDIEPRNWEDRYLKAQLEIPTYIRRQVALDVLEADMVLPKEWPRYQIDEMIDRVGIS